MTVLLSSSLIKTLLSISSMMAPQVETLRLGIVMEPPALILLYKRDGKCRRRSMPLRKLSKNSDAYNEANVLKARHLVLADVPAVKIEKFIRLLQETMSGALLASALKTVEAEFRIDVDEDLNKLSDRDLKRRKEIMDLSFNKKQLQPNDPQFVYDKQVDFSAEPKMEAGWDDEDDEESGDFWT